MNTSRIESPVALFGTISIIFLGEWLLIQQQYLSGILLYSFLLLFLLLYAAYRWETPQGQLLVFTIPPIIRLLDFTLPIGNLSPLFAQAVVAAPLTLTGFVFAWLFRQSNLSLRMKWHQVPTYLLLIVVGGLAGYILYRFEPPTPLRWNSSLLLLFYIIILLGAMALLEEWLFRGIMQSALTNLLGKGFASLIVAMVYAVLHINQGTWMFVLIIFLFALGLSWLRNSSENLLNVFLVHGAANIFFFLILPWS